MRYQLTAKCDDWWDSTLNITLFESVPDTESASLETLIEPGVKLHEKRQYSDWTVSPWCSEWASYSVTANGVDVKQEIRPFLLQYGFVQFTVTITKKDGSCKTLHSKYCNAFQTAETENLKNMVRSILEIREAHIWDLLRWPSPQVGEASKTTNSEPEKYSMISGVLQQGSGADNAHLPLKRVLETYRCQSGYFKARPEYTIKKRPVTMPFHRVKALTPDSMLWSVRTGNLHKVDVGGINVCGQNYFPTETLSEKAERDYHIYENRVILGFLDTVIRTITEKENFKREDDSFDVLRMIFYPEGAGWDEVGLAEAENLRREYQRSLRLEKRKVLRVNRLPKQTKRFQEVLPYREIYRCIYDWFRSGASWSFDDNSVFRGNLADTLYEYFCWQQLLQLFWEKGYRRCRDSKRTDYGDARKKKPPFSNVVYLEKDQKFVSLYFEPRISTWKRSGIAKECGLTLIRTVLDRDKSNKVYFDAFWTPDFLIRVEQQGRIEYAVLDAKFRSEEMLLKSNSFGGTLSPMEECLYKYYLTVSDTECLERPIRMMWLLQGRAEDIQETDREQCKTIAKNDIMNRLEFFPQSFFDALSVGIVPLNSYNKHDAMEQLWGELTGIWGL